MATFISRSPDDTLALARRCSERVNPGTRIGLFGDLGAGKTLFVRGLAAGLGISSRVHSPTFALVNEYGGGRLPLVHVDLYRLATREDVIRAGIEESLLRTDAVIVVEWAERYLGAVPEADSAGWLRYAFEVTGDLERRIAYDDPGS